jgi:hypothetical protein
MIVIALLLVILQIIIHIPFSSANSFRRASENSSILTAGKIPFDVHV